MRKYQSISTFPGNLHVMLSLMCIFLTNRRLYSLVLYLGFELFNLSHFRISSLWTNLFLILNCKTYFYLLYCVFLMEMVKTGFLWHLVVALLVVTFIINSLTCFVFFRMEDWRISCEGALADEVTGFSQEFPLLWTAWDRTQSEYSVDLRTLNLCSVLYFVVSSCKAFKSFLFVLYWVTLCERKICRIIFKSWLFTYAQCYPFC